MDRGRHLDRRDRHGRCLGRVSPVTAQSRSNASWERVLAAIEADAARAASLLIADDARVAAGIEYDGQHAPVPVDMPATWRIPGHAGTADPGAVNAARNGFAAPTATAMMTAEPANGALPRQPVVESEALPDPADLPPLTPELRNRLAQLRQRITLLQSELSTAMAEAEEILSRPAPRRATPVVAQAELVDRRL